MARPNLTDPLSVYPFWLMDLGPTDSFNFPIFTPIFGFQSITAPEMSAETTDIVEGNWIFTRKVLKRASVSNITLTRGVYFYDADFWRWMMSALVGCTAGQSILPGLGFVPIPPGIMEIGGPTYRRSFLLIQYFAKAMLPAPGLTSTAISGLLAAGAAGVAGIEVSPTALLTVSASIGLGLAGIGPFEMAARAPARAWVLLDVIPVRYKAGSDFDASSSAISIQEIEIACERFEEISLSG